MKKILIIGMYNQLGGIESFVINFYRKIDRNKFDIGFISMFETLAYEDEIKKNGDKIYYVTNVKKNPIKFYKQIKKIVKEEKYDIVHINMLSAANIMHILAVRKTNAKIIIHSHNSGTPTGSLRKILHFINKKIVQKYGDGLLACSEKAGKWLFDKKNFTIINNAIDVEKFKFDESIRKEMRKQYGLQDEIVFGHVGRFEEQKNHVFLIDTFECLVKENSKFKLLLLGKGSLKIKIQNRVMEKKLEENVIFVDETSEINKFYQMMDYFIFPSLFEGLPIVAVEAQAAGLKCFVSKDISKIVNINDEVLFFDLKEGHENFAHQILNHLDAENRIESFQKVKNSNFNLDTEVKKIEEIYETVIKK